MQRKECSCASIELAKRRVSNRMITTDKINHGLEIRRGKGLGLFTRSSLIGTLMRAGFFIAAIPISASAQTPEQIAAMQAQIAPQQAQKNADRALLEQLDAISQRDALQAQLEDAPVAANRRDSLQNQPKTGEAGANPSQQDVVSAADQSQPQQEPQSATSEALPAPVPAPAAFTPTAALQPNARGRHGYKPRPPARPQPQPTFWQRLFGHKETKKAKPGKPQP